MSEFRESGLTLVTRCDSRLPAEVTIEVLTASRRRLEVMSRLDASGRRQFLLATIYDTVAQLAEEPD